MKTSIVGLATIETNPLNPRKHSAMQIREMTRSIKEFGQIRPIVVDENNVIIAGHCLRLALTEMGEEKAVILKMEGLTESQKKKLMLADNKLGDLGMDDYGLVMELIKTMDDFEIPGYDATVLDELLRNTESAIKSYGNLEVTKEPIDRSTVVESNVFQEGPSQAIITHAPESKGGGSSLTCPYCGKEIVL